MVSYSPLTDTDVAVFQSFQSVIDSKLRKTYSSIPADFELKPVGVHYIQGCGRFYDFKMALPNGEFAKVSFNSNAGYVMGQKVSDPTEDCLTIETI